MSSKTKITAPNDEAPATLAPKLRFPEFQGAEGWENAILGNLSEVVRGGSPRPIDGFLTTAADGLNWLKIGDVDKEAKYVTHTAERVRPEALSKTRVVNPGDLILSNSMSFGRPYILQIKTCIHDGWIAITEIAKKADRDFLYYSISAPSSQRYFLDNAAGSGVQNLNADIIKALRLCFPSLPEQQKIAECLSSVDELMAAQARKVDALKTHKKGLMQQLFPREGETQPRLRFPEFQKDGEWEEKTLGELAKLVRGPFGGSLKKEIFVASGYAVYEQQHAIYSDFSSFRYHITGEKFQELRRFAVGANDIIMSCSGTMGKFAIIPDGAAPGVINQALLKLTPNGFCDTKFLKEVLELPSVQEKLLSQSAGGAIQNVVSVDQIKALPLRLPGTEEQERIAECLSSLDALITAETQKLEALKTHKKGLMQQLFPSLEEVEI